MKQIEAINAVLTTIKNCREVRAAFLKGSLAKGNGDEYSDVDFYCLVNKTEVDSFLPKRIAILQKYRPIIYYSEANFVGPQIVAVYDNGLHFDLYTVSMESFPTVGQFKPLHDPDDLLSQFNNQLDHSITNKALLKQFNSFSFSLLEFHAAFCRHDMCWAARLASHLTGHVGIALRYKYDPANAQLGMKRLETVLHDDVRVELRKAIALLHGDNLPKGVLKLCSLMQGAIVSLEETEEIRVDWELFNYMQKQIGHLL